MLFSDKKSEIKDYPVNHDYGDDETFFRIITENGEVQLPKLQFQLGQPLPDTISCRVKGYANGVPVLGHNMPRYVSEFYADGFSRGEEFEFRVVGMPDDTYGDYRLSDDNGLVFKLHDPKASLSKGQSVRCKFSVLDHNVFILKRSNTDAMFPMFTLRDCARVAMIHSVNAQRIEQFLRTIPEMEPAFDELNHGRTVWVLTAIRALRGAMPRLFRQALEEYSYEAINDAIGGYSNILLNMLQGSGFLRNIKGKERIQLQEELTSQIDQLDIYKRTLKILQSHGEQKFIRELLSNLKESGYIYHPTTQFSIMMILFRLQPDLVNYSLGRIFDTLMGWDLDTWKTEPFRQAFVEQLEIYIRDTREQIDRFLEAETYADNEMVEKVLTAIAIQQSLALPTDDIDMRLNISLFYRYLSLLRTSKADVLLNKSYLTLMGVKLPTDFTWTDIKETTMMMTRAAVDPPANAALDSTPRYYVTSDLEVEINSDGIKIEKYTDNAINVVPNGMLPWPGLTVNVDLQKGLNRAKMKTMDGHAEFWNNVEAALFVPDADTVETVSRRTPDIDDTVRIIIDKVIPSAHDYNRIDAFHCRIVDDHFIEADGYLRSTDLVNYNLHGVTVGTFRFDNGEHMMFDARVIDIDDNEKYIFSLEDTTHQAIRDIANAGEKCYCVVTKDNGRSYSAISERGFGMFVNKDDLSLPPFHKGNVIRATITGYDNDAVQGVVDDGPIDTYFFSNAKALRNLLLTIAIDNEGNTAPIELDAEDMIPREDLQEIIEIMRYKAISSRTDILMAFDYLSYARLLALTINDEKLASVIKAHKDILLLHHHYAKNKQIFAEDVRRIMENAPESTLISRMASRLLIVASLGQTDDNASLWDVATNSTNALEKELAQTVLSYNLLYGLNHDDPAAATIKDKIAKMLNVSSEQRRLKYYGSESQFVEFKSSMVYPASKGKSGLSAADPDKQEFEILHIIAGFLNTQGGTLYIGVSDDHYERGLESDFSFYKMDTSERNTKFRRSIRSLDNMANYLQQLIDSSFSLGKNAGEYAVASIDDESEKGVIAVKIKPCPHIVTLDDTIYVRHSAKTEPITKKEEIEMFRADREQLYKQIMAAGTNQDAPESRAEAKEALPEQPAAEAAPAPSFEAEVENHFDIATSAVRKNILHEWSDPDHFVPASFYIRMVGDNEFVVTTDEWSLEDTDRLDLTISDDELDGYLLLVFEGEYALKVRMREFTEKDTNTAMPYFAERKLVFAAPAPQGSALYTLHTNAKGTLYERVTPVDKIATGSMTTPPERIVEAECAGTPFMEIIPADRVEEFSAISASAIKRTQLGALAKGANVARTTAAEISEALINRLKH